MSTTDTKVSCTIAPKTSGERELAEQGPQSATIVWMIHIGTQENTMYPLKDKNGVLIRDKDGNVVPNITNNVIVFYELPDDLMTKGEYAGMPKMINQFVTMKTGVNKSGQTSKLRGIIHAAEGRILSDSEIAGYNIFDLVGKHVQLNIIHEKSKKNDGMEARITNNGINPVHKAIKVPEAKTELKWLYLPQFDNDVYKSLPEWVRKFVNMNDVPEALRPREEF